MQVKREQPDPTTVKLTLAADSGLLGEIKNSVLKHLGERMKVAGFRAGKAPMPIVERNADPAVLQSEVIDEAVSRMYDKAVADEKLRPVGQPKITLQKFVPFTTLEVTVETEAIGDIKLPDYTKIRMAKKPVEVGDKEVNDVIENLRTRAATKADVKRAAQEGDEVTIDFVGRDAKTQEPIQGAEGKDYPLLLGSNAFIPGFEKNLEGLKAGDDKSFTLEFPKDYGVAALQGRKVIFEVHVKKVQELKKAAVNDEFATTVGPFKSLAALKEDIHAQLQQEKQYEADQHYESELLKKIADDTKAAVPPMMVDAETDRLEQQMRQNLTYRGQTWQEYLDSMGKTEADYRKELAKDAEERVKGGLVLSEVANRENIQITKAELDLRIQLLKGQYKDAQMQAELDKPENRRTILSNMLTEKTLARLTEIAAQGDSKKKTKLR